MPISGDGPLAACVGGVETGQSIVSKLSGCVVGGGDLGWRGQTTVIGVGSGSGVVRRWLAWRWDAS